MSMPLISPPPTTPLTLQTNATRPQFFPDSDRIHPSTTNSRFLWLLLLSKLRGSKKCKNFHNAWWMGSRSNLTDNLDACSPSVHRTYFLPSSQSFRSQQTKPPLAGISRMQHLAQCGMDPRSNPRSLPRIWTGASPPNLLLPSRASHSQTYLTTNLSR